MSEDLESPGGEETTPDSAGEGSQDDNPNALEKQSAEELISIIRGLRKESAGYRERASKAEGQVGALTSQQQDLEKRLEELETATMSAEEKEAKRVEALEATVQQVESLMPYRDHVRAQYESDIAEVEAFEDAEKKQRYMDLLQSFPESDYLSRNRVLAALRAAEGREVKEEVKQGDEAHPGEAGGGASEKGLANVLAHSAGGLREAKMAGLIK